MSKLILDRKYITEYLKDTLNDAKMKRIIVDRAKYQHNTGYSKASSSIKYGILPSLRLKELGIINYSSKDLELMGDTESHINGSDGVSLSVAGLTDLYNDEDEYDTYNEELIGILITDDIKTRRMTEHYGNEFVFNGEILPDKFRAIDIRLLQLIDNAAYRKVSISELIEKYNCLRDIALALKQENLDIPFRERSFDDCSSLDMCKLLKAPILDLKKDI